MIKPTRHRGVTRRSPTGVIPVAGIKLDIGRRLCVAILAMPSNERKALNGSAIREPVFQQDAAARSHMGEVADAEGWGHSTSTEAFPGVRRRRRERPRRPFAAVEPVEQWSRMICGPTAQQPSSSASTTCMTAGDGRTIGPRIHISRPDGGSARCNASRARAQPSSPEVPLNPRRRLNEGVQFDVSERVGSATELRGRAQGPTGPHAQRPAI